jgi:hypothetical protein
VERVAQLYLASRRAHPVRWECIEDCAAAAVVALVWLVIGRTAGIAAAIVLGLLVLLGLITLASRVNRARHERLGAGSDPGVEA